MSVPLSNAKMIADRMKTALGDGCENCQVQGYSQMSPLFEPPPDPCTAFAIELTAAAKADGWEPMASRAAYLRRCESCKTAPRFPWAGRLDIERVRDFMQAKMDVPEGPTAFYLDELKALL